MHSRLGTVGLIAGLLLLAPSVAWGTSPATATTPLRQAAAPGAYDSLSVEVRQAITNNVLRTQGINAQPYRVELGTAQNYYPEKVAKAVWDAEAKVGKGNYGATNFSSAQVATRVRAGALPRFAIAAGRQVFTHAIPAVSAFAIGWEIGTGINKLFVDVDADPVGPSTPPAFAILTYNDQPAYASLSGWSTTPMYGDEPRAPAKSITASFAVNGHMTAANLQMNNACQDMRPNPSMYRAADGIAHNRCVATVSAKAFYWTPEDLVVHARPATVAPPHWGQLGGSTGGGGVVAQPFPVAPAAAAAEPAIRADFDSADGNLRRRVWTWVTDALPPSTDPRWNDPTYEPPALDPTSDGAPLGRTRMPPGIGTPKGEYVETLRDHDLEADVSSGFNWNRDHAPDDVLYVNPPAGEWTPRGGRVTVVANPTSVPAPTFLSGETATAYAERAYRIGWEPTIRYRDAADPNRPEDSPTGTPVPAPGTTAAPGTALRADAKNPAAVKRHDDDCTEPGFSGPDPAAAFDPGVGHIDRELAWFTAPAEAGASTPLRAGEVIRTEFEDGTFRDYSGWGWRHIKAKHGWGPAEAALTQAALHTVPASVGLNNRAQYEYGFAGKRGHACEWIVVVDRNSIPSGEGPYGVWTAYGTKL
jgi:hypothetical protein